MNGHPATEDQVLFGYFERLLRQHEQESVPPAPAVVETKPETGQAGERSQGIAAWIEGGVQVRVFRLGKLRLAAPVAQLAGVFALEGEIASRPGQPSWALGQVSVAGCAVWAASPAGLILPGLSISAPYRWVLLPHGGELALLCHAVEEPCWWRPEAVRWRKERISRPWLLGMQGDPPCPLIDVERLVQDLKR